MSQSEVYEVERRALLCLAKQESAGVGAKTASAIHLFMVLFGSSGKAASILESASIFYREVKFYVSLKQPKQESIRPEDVEGGGSVQYILHHACENARTRQHGSLHGLHVLQAMLNHPGAPCTLMTQLGADLDVIRANVDSALSLIPPEARIELSTEISPAVEKCPQPPVSNLDEYSEMLDRSKKLADEGLPVTQRVMGVLRNAHEAAAQLCSRDSLGTWHNLRRSENRAILHESENIFRVGVVARPRKSGSRSIHRNSRNGSEASSAMA